MEFKLFFDKKIERWIAGNIKEKTFYEFDSRKEAEDFIRSGRSSKKGKKKLEVYGD